MVDDQWEELKTNGKPRFVKFITDTADAPGAQLQRRDDESQVIAYFESKASRIVPVSKMRMLGGFGRTSNVKELSSSIEI